MRRALAVSLVIFAPLAAGCTSFPPEPLQLDRGLLTVDNRTASDWRGVEIWVNRYFRVTVPTIAAGSRFQVPLDAFVSGYGQRFDVRHTMLNDLRLTAKASDGTAVALVKQFEKSGLAALGEKRQ